MTPKRPLDVVEQQSSQISEDIENEVLRRYAEGAEAVQPSLCCPTDYDDQYLQVLPDEIIEKDYGCGDPSKYVGEGETVLDLGSGAGKICYILAQKVGAKGNVIGVDFNDTMINLAKKYQDEIAGKIGYDVVSFRKGKIQDLGLDLELAQAWLNDHPIHSVEDAQNYDAECELLRRTKPLVPSDTVDVIVSNCVLNLVRPDLKRQLFMDMFRVLKPGGRAVISDIVCDQDPTAAILADPELWSGCISGAFREDLFPHMFEQAGFRGIEVLVRQEEPWHVIDGVEFRSMTIRAYKPLEGEDTDRLQAVVYRGPWQSVTDEEGNHFPRGKRRAVSSRVYDTLTHENSPHHEDLIGIDPLEATPPDQAKPFDSARQNTERTAGETKGAGYHETRTDDGSSSCGPSGCC